MTLKKEGKQDKNKKNARRKRKKASLLHSLHATRSTSKRKCSRGRRVRKKITRNEMKYPFLPVLSEIKKRSSQHTSKEGNNVLDARMKCNVRYVRFTCMRAHMSERGRNISLENSLLPSRSNEGKRESRSSLPIHRHLSAFVISIISKEKLFLSFFSCSHKRKDTPSLTL